MGADKQRNMIRAHKQSDSQAKNAPNDLAEQVADALVLLKCKIVELDVIPENGEGRPVALSLKMLTRDLCKALHLLAARDLLISVPDYFLPFGQMYRMHGWTVSQASGNARERMNNGTRQFSVMPFDINFKSTACAKTLDRPVGPGFGQRRQQIYYVRLR